MPGRIQTETTAVVRQQDEIEASVQDQQGATQAGVERERSRTITQGQGIKQEVGQARQGIETAMDTGKAELSEIRGKIGQTGESLKGRVEDIQKEDVSLLKTMKEGLVGDRLSEGREKLFEESPPHPNFYPELRLKNLEKQREKKVN
ncbi:MAG: hypothetical protein HY203_05495 [Nitrospirae bacterium]|nr:hypothetical protein [Nitrospirota bacterium]